MGKHGTYYLMIVLALVLLGAKSAKSAPFCFKIVVNESGGQTATGFDCGSHDPIIVHCDTGGAITPDTSCNENCAGGSMNTLPDGCTITCPDTEEMPEVAAGIMRQARDLASSYRLIRRQCKEVGPESY